ncbi:hypothetical protein Clacol_000232 [Clathrus columnatus]|uniref:Uncharacterized protein n=1 Tax=Clathrus columnatus TaxID=1419009 RepID=A0AAV4ZWD2_9AGAM|nr:hypothetical protein Clacol_000232 [Clathrus columnatus]
MGQQLPLNVAAIIAIIIESILYGISTLMFLWTLWALFHNKSTHINKVLLTVTWVLIILGTLHLIVDARRAYLGFIESETYFLDNNFNTYKNIVYGLETLVADAVLIYRCHIVWRDIRILALPIILWLSTVVTAIHTIWSVAQPIMGGEALFLHQTARWVASFYATALATNIVSTGLLAYKIWRVNASVNVPSSSVGTLRMNPRIRSLLLVILECGALYSLSLVTMLVIYFSKSNGAYIMIDIIGQIIPITFYMLIIRTSFHRITEKQIIKLHNQPSSNNLPRSDREINNVRVDEAMKHELASLLDKKNHMDSTLIGSNNWQDRTILE